MSPARLFPIGHWLGPHDDGSHRIRVGPTLFDLHDSAEVTVWQLAHGRAGDPAPVTVDAVLAGADQVGRTDAGAALARLREVGLLVPAHPDALDGLRFARGHRLEGLMTGLGMSPDTKDPGTVAVGPAGHPVAWLSPASFEAWRWGGATASLWELATLIRAGATADNGPVLESLLAGLHDLLAVHAVYLDVVTS